VGKKEKFKTWSIEPTQRRMRARIQAVRILFIHLSLADQLFQRP
jgi:hypothetical protein